jgi:hypothetical protein
LGDFELVQLVNEGHEASMDIYGAPKIFMRLKATGVLHLVKGKLF